MLDWSRGGGDFLASIRPTTPSLTRVNFLKTTTSKLFGDGIRGDVSAKPLSGM